jgi:hypothetical protein
MGWEYLLRGAGQGRGDHGIITGITNRSRAHHGGVQALSLAREASGTKFNRIGDASYVDANDFERVGGMSATSAHIVASPADVRGLVFPSLRTVGEH